MGGSIRTLLICLLVLSVPAQGAAAATMVLCGPNHHGDGAGVTMVHAQAGGLSSTSAHDRPHDRPHAHSNDHAQHSAATHAAHDHAVADLPAVGEASASAQGIHAGQHKCSACASCCSVSAMLSPVLAVPVPDVAPTVFSAVVPSVEAFSADGPDRPPRIVLA